MAAGWCRSSRPHKAQVRHSLKRTQSSKEKTVELEGSVDDMSIPCSLAEKAVAVVVSTSYDSS